MVRLPAGPRKSFPWDAQAARILTVSRKLVFIATAKSLKFDLARYGQAVDNAINDVGAISEITRERQEAHQAEIAVRNEGVCTALETLFADKAQGPALASFLRSQLGLSKGN